MTTATLGTITVDPRDDPDQVWQVIRTAATACGLTPLPAVRLALAVTELVGRPRQPATVVLAVVTGEDGTCVEAAVRGGAGSRSALPAGLTDSCVERPAATGGIEHVVAVAAGGSAPAEHEPEVLRDALDGGAGTQALLGAALVAVDQQAARLVASDAETGEFRAELDATNRGLLAVYAELQTANQRIADLVAMLSHDLRQPLGIITSYCGLLLQEWGELDDAGRREDLTRIANAGTCMTQLVEEILTLAQLDAEGLGARAAPVEVGRAAAEAVANVSGAGTVVVHDRESWVYADPRHVHQILTNLLSNALKYGIPPVEITVTATAEAVDISVRDHGEGVPVEFVPRLFSRFARADTAASRDKKGTGLGLYIVRQLVEANRGTVRYVDHQAGGGCFTVRLPRHPQL